MPLEVIGIWSCKNNEESLNVLIWKNPQDILLIIIKLCKNTLILLPLHKKTTKTKLYIYTCLDCLKIFFEEFTRN